MAARYEALVEPRDVCRVRAGWIAAIGVAPRRLDQAAADARTVAEQFAKRRGAVERLLFEITADVDDLIMLDLPELARAVKLFKAQTHRIGAPVTARAFLVIQMRLKPRTRRLERRVIDILHDREIDICRGRGDFLAQEDLA